jgi:peroxiredoxin
MAILKKGAKAPDFTLAGLRGERRSLAEMLAQGPVLLVFFKVSCPTCQYTLPYLERLRNARISVIGVSQDNQRNTEAFNREYGISFPVLLDPAAEDYRVSNAYGLTHVPSLVWVEPGGSIALTSAGFVKADLDEVASRAGLERMFQPHEGVPAFRAG